MIHLETNEEIRFIVRKHWFTFISDMIIMSLFLLVPAGILTLLYYLHSYFELAGSVIALGATASFLFFLVAWVTAFTIWTDYYLDILIVTDKHIINVEQRGFFSRELSTFRIDRIQDITSETNGLLQTFLSFGTLHIQTAGEDRDFIVHGVPRPSEMRDKISNIQSTLLDEREATADHI